MADNTVHLWKLNDGCEHVVAAKDEETARARGADTYSIGDGGEPVTCKRIPDDEPFSVCYADGLEPPYPPGAEIDEELRLVIAPAAVWAEFCGNGVYVGGEDC